MDTVTKCFAGILMTAVCSFSQTDPGPRKGAAGAGGPYSGLNAAEQSFFNAAKLVFQEIDSVSGTLAGEPGVGLGPTFNANGCAVCHAQPAAGGSSPGMQSPQVPGPNPQVALAKLHGANNTAPSFITIDGPVREARFIRGSGNGTLLDGGVHGLYTIAGRSDATGCVLAQPDFATQVANHNVIFRIPTPTFGLGLVENTPDSVLQANMAANQNQKNALGITGRLNTSGNDGSVTRFGWKAQNKSLMVFAGEAYNVEQGVSNEVFPNERSAVAGCVYNATPEDHTNFVGAGGISSISSDLLNFAGFMRMSAAPTPTTSTPSEKNGQLLFSSVGCAYCHSPTLTTAASIYTDMSNVTYHPYSDFALHSMGTNLADFVIQGGAGLMEFRTAPLWGVGQRLFFMHDGRTSDLMQAIEAHFSSGMACTPQKSPDTVTASTLTALCASEANGVIQNFRALNTQQKQDLLNFLRSL